MIHWIARLEEAPTHLDGAIVWIARHGDAEASPLPPPETADLADAALAKRDGGGARLLRRRMLRALVARTFALHPSAVRFTRNACGAPGLEGLAAFISTAGCAAEGEAWSAVALALHPVGVDVETGPPTDALTRWTLVEAYVKALGTGLVVSPERVHAERCGTRWRLEIDGLAEGVGEVHLALPLVAACAALLRQADGERV